MSAAVTRPKIHKLPALPRSEKKRPSLKGYGLAGVVALLVLSVASLTHIRQRNTVPVPASSYAVQEPSAGKPESGVVTSAMADTLSPDGKTIVLEGGESGRIVGRLAKIPAESEQITEIKPVSDIDNATGHELLSIIGKY